MIDLPLAEKIVAFLNELTAIDPVGVMSLCENRVPCNNELTSHPTVQVGFNRGGFHEVGMLGVLNGLCGVYDNGPRAGHGPIRMVFDVCDEPDGKQTIRWFEINKNEE